MSYDDDDDDVYSGVATGGSDSSMN